MTTRDLKDRNKLPWTRIWLSGRMLYEHDRTGYFPRLNSNDLFNPLPDYVPLSGLDHIRCLVLLGERGMGKSHELAKDRERLLRREDPPVIVYCDVQNTSVQAALSAGLKKDLRRALKAHAGEVHIFIDSMDAAPDGVALGVPLIGARLGELTPTERNRVRLRLACRSSDWLKEHEPVLKTYFQGQPTDYDIGFYVYRLAPLTREDVVLAAEARKLDPETFLESVRAARAESLAERPMTLRPLLDRASVEDDLTDDPVELYRESISELCRETSSVREQRARRTYAPELLHELAEHVAAVTMFTSASIWGDDIGRAERPPEAITIGELSEGVTFRRGEVPRSVDSDEIRATTRTALFRGGVGTIEFVHRSLAEFLAADCLRTRGLPPEEILRLVQDPKGTTPLVASHLRGVAAWTVAMMPETRRLFEDTNPHVVLQAGRHCYDDDALRRRLTQRLLDCFATGYLSNTSEDETHYADLAHPGLEQQLAEYLTRPNLPDASLRLARQIARACKVALPWPTLVGFVLDRTLLEKRRGFAAFLVAECQDPAVRSTLAPALDDLDLPDEARGPVLRALWPGLIGVEDLVTALTPARRDNVYGEYQQFLSEHLFRGIRRDALLQDVPPLLRGVAGRASIPSKTQLAQLAQRLLKGVWQCLEEEPGLASAFAEALVARMIAVAEGRETLALDHILNDDTMMRRTNGWQCEVTSTAQYTPQRCRIVMQELVPALATRNVGPTVQDRVLDILVVAEPPLMHREEGAWLADRIAAGPSAELPIWLALRDKLTSARPLWNRLPVAHFVNRERMESLRDQPWVQNAQSWGGIKVAAPRDTSEEPAPVAVPAVAKPSVMARRKVMSSQRQGILRVLGQQKMPLRGSNDLFDAVLRSLRRLEDRLQGSTPLAFALWNEQAESCAPKPEVALSDMIADHLRRDLSEVAAIVAREVEINGRKKIDVDIQTPRLPGQPPTRVIIEVKGCWNDDLEASLDGQLRKRYLTDGREGYGIYLIGHYDASDWNPKDERRSTALAAPAIFDRLRDRAKTLSKEHQKRIEVEVLDCRLRNRPVPRKSTQKQRQKTPVAP